MSGDRKPCVCGSLDATLRDEIAIRVLAALIQAGGRWNFNGKPVDRDEQFAEIAYRFADRMMKAREVRA